MACQLVTRHLTNGMDEILTVKVLKPILIGIVCVGMVVELMSGGIFHPILITSILEEAIRTHVTIRTETYTILLFIEHEGSNGSTLIGVRPGLPMNADGSTANTEVVGGTWDGAERGRHCRVSDESRR